MDTNKKLVLLVVIAGVISVGTTIWLSPHQITVRETASGRERVADCDDPVRLGDTVTIRSFLDYKMRMEITHWYVVSKNGKSRVSRKDDSDPVQAVVVRP